MHIILLILALIFLLGVETGYRLPNPYDTEELDYPIRKRKGSQRWGARNR